MLEDAEAGEEEVSHVADRPLVDRFVATSGMCVTIGKIAEEMSVMTAAIFGKTDTMTAAGLVEDGG